MPDPRMPDFRLRCPPCGRSESADSRSSRCPECDGSWLIEYLFPAAESPARAPGIPQIPRLPGLFRYLPMLPVRDVAAIVSLGEGGTPLLRAARLGARLGVGSLTLKDEARNPTGSFKDRMLAVGIARARELSHHTVAVQSSGNVGASAAAYAAAAGLSAKIFVPRTVPQGKLVQIAMYGADLVRVDHPSPAFIFELLLWASQELGWYIVSTTARYNPFVLEGAKTIVYELAEQTSFVLPDWLIAPVGGGGNLGLLWRALLELRALGLVQRLPRLAGVQAAGCAPFVAAVREGRSVQQAGTQAWPQIDTVAGAIADDLVFDAHVALPAIRDSGGTAVAVPDQETLEMQRALAADEGLFVEPASAVALAGLRRLRQEGTIEEGASVCCLLTGNGLKDVATAAASLPDVPLVAPTRAAIAARVRAR
jgi:threonine synthase